MIIYKRIINIINTCQLNLNENVLNQILYNVKGMDRILRFFDDNNNNINSENELQKRLVKSEE